MNDVRIPFGTDFNFNTPTLDYARDVASWKTVPNDLEVRARAQYLNAGYFSPVAGAAVGCYGCGAPLSGPHLHHELARGDGGSPWCVDCIIREGLVADGRWHEDDDECECVIAAVRALSLDR